MVPVIRKQLFSTCTRTFKCYLDQSFKKRYSSEKKNEDSYNTIRETISEKNYKRLHQRKHESPKKEIMNFKKKFAIVIILSMVYLGHTLGSPGTDPFGDPIQDDLSKKPIIVQYIIRIFRQLKYYRRLLRAPTDEKLLPDPLQFPYLQPKYTLVIELTDVLVHREWNKDTGWRYKKRPLLDYFLETLQHHYEIVIYTAEQGMIAFPLIEAIDSNKIIAHKLVRDATYFTGGSHIKTLDKLNRNLSKVVCVDWNQKNVKFNPENLFRIKRWSGNDNDTSLIDLASFLKTIATNDIEDVREVLKSYSKYDDPVQAYSEKQRRRIEDLDQQAATNKENSNPE